MNPNLVAMILVEPENPENIGAAARAMKNMGFSDFRLVNPPKNWYENGKKMAMAAEDVFRQAAIYSSLPEAAKDCHLAVATSRRYGNRRGDFLGFEKSIQKIEKLSAKDKIAFVFGRESKGLANEHIAFCDWTTTIDTDSGCPSINLAQSVMIVSFALKNAHLFKESKRSRDYSKRRTPYQKEALGKVDKSETLEVVSALKEALVALNYREEGVDVIDRIQATFYGLIKRSGLLRSEAKMFKGLTRRIRDRYNDAKLRGIHG